MAATRPDWSDAELMQLFDRVDNTGRWGADDELGTLNYITPETRCAAARLVQTGEAVSLAHPLAPRSIANPSGQIEQHMLYGHLPRPSRVVPASAGDFIGLDVHQVAVTHLDALSHVAGHDGRVYNGRRFDDVVTASGLAYGAIDAQRDGIVSRGVLLDVAAALGVDWLEPSHQITGAQLEAAERYGAVRVSRGDVMIVRAGNEARGTATDWQPLSPGPGPDCLEWIHQREAAVYAGDAPEHITAAAAAILGLTPPAAAGLGDQARTLFPLPVHQIGLAAMGLVLLDHCRVEELARTCRRLGRYEFLFFAAPLPLSGGTGSPVNPIAVF
jgi:kynurenine formamidase